MTMPRLKVGKTPPIDLPSHVKGIKQGNSRGNYERQVGWTPGGEAKAESATGINPDARAPIDPRMPNLPPG
jgi:hypothetical protein